MDKFAAILKDLRPVKEKNKIRLGRKWDGGYVLSRRILDASQVLISLGVNNEWSFEAGCLKSKPFDQLIMVDDQGSPQIMRDLFFKSVGDVVFKFYDKVVFNRFKFRTKKFIHYTLLSNRYKVKYLQLRIGNGPAETGLDQLIHQQLIQTGKQNILLKIDIEGSEYHIISDIVNGSQNYSGVIIEFHDLLSQPEQFSKAIQQMKQGFEIIHVHFNNYTPRNEYLADVVEISFVNKSWVDHPEWETNDYPVPGLDYPCNRDMKDYEIKWPLPPAPNF